MKNVGIVTFNPEIDRLKKSLDILLEISDYICIVDNSSDNLQDIEELISSSDKVTLIKNKTNFGIAKALNQIATFYMEINEQWVLLLDQDSIVSIDFYTTYKQYIEINDIGVICPLI